MQSIYGDELLQGRLAKLSGQHTGMGELGVVERAVEHILIVNRDDGVDLLAELERVGVMDAYLITWLENDWLGRGLDHQIWPSSKYTLNHEGFLSWQCLHGWAVPMKS